MNDHLSDADLVALALLPDEAPDARLHLASCVECAARMDRATTEVDRHRREHASSVEKRDATFWKRQELAIMREVSRSSRHRNAPRRSFVAAAVVAVAIGGFWFGRASVPDAPTVELATTTAVSSPVTATTTTSSAVLVPASDVSADPWDSESLEEFQAVVDWETWVDDNGKDQGTI